MSSKAREKILKASRHTIERSRRSILRSIGGGTTIGGLSVTGKAARPDYIDIPIVMDKSGDEILKTKSVPEPWWSHLKEVREVNRKAQRKYLGKTGVRTVGYGYSHEVIEGKHGFDIVIGLDPNVPSPEIPPEIDGINTRTRKADPQPFTHESDGWCSNLARFDPAPGGVTINADNCSSLARGSTGFKVQDSDSDPGMLTANHIFACGVEDHAAPAEQCCEFIDYVGQDDKTADFAIVGGDSPWSDQIKEEDSTYWNISGFYTDNGIDDLISDTEVVYRTGVGYGTDDGPVRENNVGLSGINCDITLDDEGVWLEIDAAETDSGGPAYGLETFNGKQYAVIINHLSAGDNIYDQLTCGSNDSCGYESETFDIGSHFYGTAFNHINGHYGVDIY